MFSGPGHVLWTGPYLFRTWGHEKCVGRACVFSAPCGGIFWDLHVFVLDPGIFVSSAKLFVSDIGFCFLDPCTCFVDLGSIGWGGELHCYMRSHWAGCFWTVAPFFFDMHMFFLTWHRAGEFRYWAKMHARSCWGKGKFGYWNNINVRSGGEAGGGKSTYEATWT